MSLVKVGNCCCPYATAMQISDVLDSQRDIPDFPLEVLSYHDHGRLTGFVPDSETYYGPTHSYANCIAHDPINSRLATAGLRVKRPRENDADFTGWVTTRVFTHPFGEIRSWDHGPPPDQYQLDDVNDYDLTDYSPLEYFLVRQLAFDSNGDLLATGVRVQHPNHEGNATTYKYNPGNGEPSLVIDFGGDTVGVATHGTDFFVAGFEGLPGNQTCLLKAYDSAGTVDWEFILDHDGIFSAESVAVAADDTGVYLIYSPANQTEFFQHGNYLQKFDFDGNILWKRCGGRVNSRVVANGTHCYVSSYQNNFCSLDGTPAATEFAELIAAEVPPDSLATEWSYQVVQFDAGTGEAGWVTTLCPGAIADIAITGEGFVWVVGQGSKMGLPGAFCDLGVDNDAQKQNLWELNSSGEVIRAVSLGKPERILLGVASHNNFLYVCGQRGTPFRIKQRTIRVLGTDCLGCFEPLTCGEGYLFPDAWTLELADLSDENVYVDETAGSLPCVVTCAGLLEGGWELRNDRFVGQADTSWNSEPSSISVCGDELDFLVQHNLPEGQEEIIYNPVRMYCTGEKLKLILTWVGTIPNTNYHVGGTEPHSHFTGLAIYETLSAIVADGANTLTKTAYFPGADEFGVSLDFLGCLEANLPETIVVTPVAA